MICSCCRNFFRQQNDSESALQVTMSSELSFYSMQEVTIEGRHSIECITHAGHSIAFLHFATL